MSSTESLATTLAAEQAAVFVLGILGARTSRAAQPQLSTGLAAAYTVHRGRRDHLERWLRDLGVEPSPPAPAYDVTHDLGTDAKVRAVALEVEATVCATYADLVAATDGDGRRWAVAALTDAALRQVAFGGLPVHFPGLGEFAGR